MLTPTPTPPPQKFFLRARRAFVACAACRKRKIRCRATTAADGTCKACTRCSLKGLTCEYLIPESTSGTSHPTGACLACRTSKIKCSRVADGDTTRPCTNCAQKNATCVAPSSADPPYRSTDTPPPWHHLQTLPPHPWHGHEYEYESQSQPRPRPHSCPHAHADADADGRWSPRPLALRSAAIVDRLERQSVGYPLPGPGRLLQVHAPHPQQGRRASFPSYPDPSLYPIASPTDYQPELGAFVDGGPGNVPGVDWQNMDLNLNFDLGRLGLLFFDTSQQPNTNHPDECYYDNYDYQQLNV
ncbi:hypothetical protein C8R46DRAFT_1109036 [Mycena filopes]|nr:hypothetical protein C8R46DRAFT_1109036 [Mycena filopes]